MYKKSITLILLLYTVNFYGQELHIENNLMNDITLINTTHKRNIKTKSYDTDNSKKDSNSIYLNNLKNSTCDLPGWFTIYSITSKTTTSFNVNWMASTDAKHYILDVSTNSSFSNYVLEYKNLNVLNVLSYFVTGLIPGTKYYVRVIAVNDCGSTTNRNTVCIETITPPSKGCNPYQSVEEYKTTALIPGSTKTWITRNLGALKEATSSIDISDSAAGCYFQFNRLNAYGFDTNGEVKPTWKILSISENCNWKKENDPCKQQLGEDWRIPTKTEWASVNEINRWESFTSTYSIAFKLHAAGGLDIPDGALILRGIEGYYWSSDAFDLENAHYWFFSPYYTMMDTMDKASGFSVRCLK